MTAADVLPHRLLVLAAAFLLSLFVVAPAVTRASSYDAELVATLELPQGGIDFALEVGMPQFFNEENAPFAIEVIDGCAVNGHYWVFGAGLSAVPLRITVMDERSGESYRVVLPAFEPGEAIGTILEPEALAICRDVPAGGLPTLSGTATYTPASARCTASTEGIELLSEGQDHAYRTLLRSGHDVNRVIHDAPIAIVDELGNADELHLLVESRTPRLIEGVVFYGRQGMLPKRAKLDKRLDELTNARVRRAYETAKNGRVPQGIIEDLGLRDVDCVHHVSLQLDSLGADAYLAEAGWIKDGGLPLELPKLVEERFSVEIVHADGESTRLPLTGPLIGSDDEGLSWEYESPDAKVQVVDGCSLSDSYWIIAAAATDEPVQLVVGDTQTGMSASLLLWTDREAISRLADTSALTPCP